MTTGRHIAIHCVVAGIAATAIASTSCLLTSGIDDYDSAHGRSDASPARDAATEGTAPTSEGGASCDAGFCACSGASHDACFDFDTPPAITGWEIQQGGGGVVDFIGSDVISPPTSLRARIPGTQTPVGRANIELLDHRVATKLRVEMDMIVDEADTTGGQSNGTHGACPISIELGTGTVIRVNLFADGMNIEQLVNGSSADVAVGSMRTSAGTRARLGLWFDFDARKCGATVDGLEQLPGCTLADGFKSGPTHVAIGMIFVRPPTSAWAIRADNVTIDYR